MGSGVQKYGYNGMFGPHPQCPAVRPADVTDGATHTVAMAEWLLATGDHAKIDARRTIFKTPETLALPSEMERFASLCAGLDVPNTRPGGLIKGLNWLHGEFGHTLYNHVLPVNGRSCTNGTLVQEDAYSAGSLHPGGANIVYADGRVDFVRDSIELSIWRALASRGGGEITGER